MAVYGKAMETYLESNEPQTDGSRPFTNIRKLATAVDFVQSGAATINTDIATYDSKDYAVLDNDPTAVQRVRQSDSCGLGTWNLSARVDINDPCVSIVRAIYMKVDVNKL